MTLDHIAADLAPVLGDEAAARAAPKIALRHKDISAAYAAVEALPAHHQVGIARLVAEQLSDFDAAYKIIEACDDLDCDLRVENAKANGWGHADERARLEWVQ